MNNAIHPIPVRDDHDGVVTLDMVLQRELANCEKKLLVPAAVVVGGEVEDDRDE